MITAGDEMGRTQKGNNNAYCQDNETSWVNWELDQLKRDLLKFAIHVFGIRRKNPVLRRRAFFRGAPVPGDTGKDLAWLRPEGGEMTEADWKDPKHHALGMLIHGQATDEVDERGRLISGDTLLLIVNSGRSPCDFKLPTLEALGRWRELVDTWHPHERHYVEQKELSVSAHTLVLLDYEET
jgi:glycogen operon protein